MATGEPARGRFVLGPVLAGTCLIWAVGMVAVYGRALLPCVLVESYGGIIPDLRQDALARLGNLAGRAGLLCAGVLGALLTGRRAGRSLGRFARLDFSSGPHAVPVGWMALGLVLLGLGLTGLWFPSLLIVALALFLSPGGLAGVRSHLRSGGFWLRPIVLLPALAAGWCLLLLSVAPESFQDPLRYHLFLPKQFLLAHKAVFMRDFFFWSYFGPVHALYGAAIAAGGQIGAQAVNLAAFLLALAAVHRIAAAARLPVPDRPLLMGLLLSAPGLLLVTGCTFVEHGHVLYVLLALDWALRRNVSRRARLRAMALLAGHAFAVKYTAAFGIAGLAAAVASRPDRRRWWSAWRAHPGSASFAAAAFLPWGAWNWLCTRDPVSPVLTRFGMDTMDRSAAGVLESYYGFTRAAYEKWLGTPGSLLEIPLELSGAHTMFWENPGPALPALLPLAVLVARYAAPPRRAVIVFALASLGAWMVVFGGASPHYVMAYAGVWMAGMLCALPALPRPAGRAARRLLAGAVAIQAIVGTAGVADRWRPVDVATGKLTRGEYLTRTLEPREVRYPLRCWLNERLVKRDRVYLWGDTDAAYINARVHPDYEYAPAPLLWRMANESRDGDALRRRFKQRGFTFMVYSTFWPMVLARTGDMPFRRDARDLGVVQDFWRRWAEPAVGAYPEPGTPGSPAWVVGLRRTPREGMIRVDRWRHPEILPGSSGLVWPAIAMERDGDRRGALAAYRKILVRYPNYALIMLQASRLLVEQGERAEAGRLREAAGALGWATGAGDS